MTEKKAGFGETCINSRRIYDGRILNLRVDDIVLPNGRNASREVVEHEPAVVIVAENDRGEVLLIDQYRYAVGSTIIELPAGIVEEQEDLVSAAARELQEETGWKPLNMQQIADVYSSPGFSNERLILFYATGLTANKLPADDDEFIVARFVSREDVLSLVQHGEIVDGKTLLGLYWWLYCKQ